MEHAETQEALQSLGYSIIGRFNHRGGFVRPDDPAVSTPGLDRLHDPHTHPFGGIHRG